jgi:hypothetical protein
MPSQVKSIHVIGVCLVVLFGFILNNQVDARAPPRKHTNAALEDKRHEQSALRKRAFRLQSMDDEGDRKYEQAVRAVLAYAQHELKQHKRDDSAYGSSYGSGYGSGNVSDAGSGYGSGYGSGSGFSARSENGASDELENDESDTLTELVSRLFQQRQANKRHWRNK